MPRSDHLALQCLRLLRAIGESALAFLAQRQVTRCWHVLIWAWAPSLELRSNLRRCADRQFVSKDPILAQNPEQKVLGADPGGAKNTSFVTREENRAAGMFVISVKHDRVPRLILAR